MKVRSVSFSKYKVKFNTYIFERLDLFSFLFTQIVLDEHIDKHSRIVDCLNDLDIKEDLWYLFNNVYYRFLDNKIIEDANKETFEDLIVDDIKIDERFIEYLKRGLFPSLEQEEEKEFIYDYLNNKIVLETKESKEDNICVFRVNNAKENIEKILNDNKEGLLNIKDGICIVKEFVVDPYYFDVDLTENNGVLISSHENKADIYKALVDNSLFIDDQIVEGELFTNNVYFECLYGDLMMRDYCKYLFVYDKEKEFLVDKDVIYVGYKIDGELVDLSKKVRYLCGKYLLENNQYVSTCRKDKSQDISEFKLYLVKNKKMFSNNIEKIIELIQGGDFMDYYKILNLKEDATIKEIEQAYNDLSSFYNPKNNVSKSAYKKYREVEQAYNVLKEKRQREIYNLSRKNVIVEDKEIVYDGTFVDINDFDMHNYDIQDLEINEFKDALVEDIYSDYLKLNIKLPYLYYLLNCEYEVDYEKEVFKENDKVCPVCLGIGKVKEDNKVVYCKECLHTGKEVVKRKVKVKKSIRVDNQVIINEDRVIVNFDFFDINEYEVKGNEIRFNYRVSESEYYDGVKFNLKRNDSNLEILKNDFSLLEDTYIFLDKIIKIHWDLSKYKGRDKYGYLISNHQIIYLNPKDYTYSYKSTDVCNYKVEITGRIIRIENLGDKGYQDKNGDLILEVINLENDTELKIFFNKKIKKVSKSLFMMKGEYNNHIFKGKNKFDYDDNYLYIPSLASKVELKKFFIFRLLLSMIYLFIPIIFLLIFSISYIFFIVTFICLLLYVIGALLVMEVKI